MFRLVSPTAPLITAGDLWLGIKSVILSKSAISDFEKDFCNFQGLKYVHFLSSGRAALYAILMTLKQKSSRKEVVIPAFICPVVAISIIKAGCKVVACDISKDTLDYNLIELRRIVSPSTLCIVAVHLCGLPCNMNEIHRIARETKTFVVEDCAHAIGSSLNGKMMGTYGDFSFFSFGKGKCMTTNNGGAVGTMSQAHYMAFQQTLLTLDVNRPEKSVFSLLELIGYAVFIKPFFFNLVGRLLSEMLDANISTNLKVARFSNFQAAIGLSVLKKMNRTNSEAVEKALYLSKGLYGIKNIKIPEMLDGATPNFLRFPILVESENVREKLLDRLTKNGIKAGILYGKTINKVRGLNVNNFGSDYKDADYVADEIITLPTHQFVNKKDLDIMIDIITKSELM